MNSRAPGLATAASISGAMPPPQPGLAARNASRRIAVRLGVAVALSLAVHVLLVGGTVLGWWDLMPWLSTSEPLPTVVRAHLLPAPPPPSPALPETASRTASKPEAVSKAPVRRPRLTPPASPLLTADAGTTMAVPAAPDTGTAPAGVPQVPGAGTTAAAPAAASAPAPPRASPLPQRARILYDIIYEANNTRISGVQDWEMKDGRYRTRLGGEFKIFAKVFVSIWAESSGAVSADGLRVQHYVYERNAKRAVVDIAPDFRSAAVEEMSGNHKTVALSGETADLASLAYHLAFVPDLPVGSALSFFNRDNLEEVRLVDRRDEVLSLDSMNLQTRYYEFRRADGSGGAQIWLATDHQWLPAKMRIAGRDGVAVFVVTRYDLNPPD